MENIWIHLITVISIIVILWVAIFLPWLVGRALNKAIGSERDDYFGVWGFGATVTLLISLVIFFIYSAYIDIFTYYTKP